MRGAVDLDERAGGRGLRMWIALAISSLPVPFSPWIEHVGVARAPPRRPARTARASPCSVPMMFAKRRIAELALQLLVRDRSLHLAVGRSRMPTMPSGSSCDFSRKKKAPAWPASSARAMVPWPLMTMTSAPGARALSPFSTAMPSTSGRSRSSSTTRGAIRRTIHHPVRPQPGRAHFERGLDRSLLDHHLEPVDHGRLVVDDQDTRRARLHSSHGPSCHLFLKGPLPSFLQRSWASAIIRAWRTRPTLPPDHARAVGAARPAGARRRRQTSASAAAPRCTGCTPSGAARPAGFKTDCCGW